MDWCPFSERQLDFIKNSTARICIADGAVRAGKTIACNVRFLTYLATGPKGDLALFGRTRDTLQRNVLNTLFEIVGTKNYCWINKQSGELSFLGRRIYCFGANNEEAESKIRGATFAGALCDEVNLYPENVFNQILARLSVKGAQCFVNCNPGGPTHWFYKNYIANENITNKQRWQFLMEDNLSLDEAFMEGLKTEYRGVWYDRMILGKWVAAEGLIYSMFDTKVHTRENAYENRLQEKGVNPGAITWICACDYATSSVMSWGLYAIFPDNFIVKHREFYYNAIVKREQLSDAQFGGKFQIWLGGLDPYKVYCDPSASSWKTELRTRGYRVGDGNNDVINGIREVSARLSKNMYQIDSSCVSSIAEYQAYVWDDKSQEIGVDRPLKQFDHAVDTDRYGLTSTVAKGFNGTYGVKA